MKKLLTKLRNARQRRKAEVLYLCDRKACKVCKPEQCRHTTDVNHAVNFRFSDSRAYVEQ